jgi:hypothetical protein
MGDGGRVRRKRREPRLPPPMKADGGGLFGGERIGRISFQRRRDKGNFLSLGFIF